MQYFEANPNGVGGEAVRGEAHLRNVISMGNTRGTSTMDAISGVSDADVKSIFDYLTAVRDGDFTRADGARIDNTTSPATPGIVFSSNAPVIADGLHESETLPRVVVTNRRATSAGFESLVLSEHFIFKSTSTCVINGTPIQSLNSDTSCFLDIAFNPKSTVNFASGSISALVTGALTVQLKPAGIIVATQPVVISLAGTAQKPQFTPSIQVSATTLNFSVPTVVNTETLSQIITVTNSNQVSAPLIIGSLTKKGTGALDFDMQGTCANQTSLAPGFSCTISVKFAPKATGARPAVIEILSNDPRGAFTLTLNGTGALVAGSGIRLTFAESGIPLTPSSQLDFGLQTVGRASPSRPIQIESVGTVALNVTAVTGQGLGFSQTNTCQASLAPGATCLVNVVFSPNSAGPPLTGRIIVNSDAPGGPFSVQLSGQGTGLDTAVLDWSAPASPIDFGEIMAGFGSSVRSVTLVNRGPVDSKINVINAIGPNASDFSLISTEPGGCAVGQTLAANSTCRIDVRFVPGSGGAKTASIQVAANGTSPAEIRLTGTGMAGPSAAINLSTPQVVFDPVRVGNASNPAEISISSTGTGIVSIQAITVSGPFVLQNKTCPTPPFTLAVGSQCAVVVSYLAQTEGSATGKLTVKSDAGSGVSETSLSGSAQAQANVSSGGGCSISDPDSAADPTLPGLVLLALAALAYRRQGQRKIENARSMPDGGN